jgi:hypothetical protein
LYELLGVPPHGDLTSRFAERTSDEWETWAQEHGLPIVAVKRI